MPDSLPSNDKIEVLVGLVLQAVDQRLTTVREQIIELSNSVVRSHSDLHQQIAECRALIASETGTAQLVQAANVLTERVTSLEARVNQYTDERFAELQATVQTLAPVKAPAVAPVAAVVAPPAAAVTSSAVPVFTPVAPTKLTPVSAPSVVAAPAPAAAASASAAPDSDFDLDAFSAQLNARLSVLVERAIGA